MRFASTLGGWRMDLTTFRKRAAVTAGRKEASFCTKVFNEPFFNVRQ
jgi:hypothetical protein